MAKQTIDINCDLGEGSENDDLLMPFISSCSIACGGHYGDEKTIAAAIRLAKKNQVKVGAHPSFPDKENFGRKIISISKNDLEANISHQIKTFQEVCKIEGVQINHIKLHGALYNLAAKDEQTATTILTAVKKTNVKVSIYAPYQSVLADLAQTNFNVIFEAFADRQYHSDLQLVARSENGAVISNPTFAWKQVQRILQKSEVLSIEGGKVKIEAQTFCIHGDQPNAVALASYIHEQLMENNISIG